MLHYISDGKYVNLPAQLSTEFYAKNPLMTKQGEYTLDIDIDLRDPHNAGVYQNCHRIDIHDTPTGRHATLYDEQGTIIDGEEIILEINERKIKVQVVGDVSQFNYSIAAGQTLHTLKTSKEYVIGGEESDVATVIIDGQYTNYHAILAPGVVQVEKLMAEYAVPTVNHGVPPEPTSHDFNPGSGNYPYVVARLEKLCIFPWLWFTVEAVINALGYTTRYNHIKADTRLQRLLVIQSNALSAGQSVLHMLPDWDVATFITEVEKLCNVVFVPHREDNSISVLSVATYYSDNTHTCVIKTEDLIGEIEKKIDNDTDSDSDIITLYDQVKYKLPAYPQYKYLSVDEEVMEINTPVTCEHLTSDSEKRSYIHNVWRAIKGSWDFETDRRSTETEKEYREGNHIFYDPALKMQFVLKYQEESEENIYSNPILPYQEKELLYTLNFHSSFYLQHINTYRPVVNKKDGNTVEMKIIPCEMAWRRFSYRDQDGMSRVKYAPIPCVRNYTDYKAAPFYIFGEDEPDGKNIINDEIINGVDSVAVPDNIFVAFYFGRYGDDNEQQYPVVSPTNRLVRYINSAMPDCLTAQVVVIDNRERDMTLELDGEDGMYATNYAKNEKYDNNREYTIRFKTVGRPDPKSVFIIDHVKFFCKQLKYTVKDGRISEVVEGIFYPAKDNEE